MAFPIIFAALVMVFAAFGGDAATADDETSISHFPVDKEGGGTPEPDNAVRGG